MIAREAAKMLVEASMRPQRIAAEYKRKHNASIIFSCASMRPQRIAAEYL